jgi:excinuclease ABC subunit B
MYADKMTESMREAIGETDRRRSLQVAYNLEHGITPETVRKAIYGMELEKKELEADGLELMAGAGLPRADLIAIVRDLEKEMKRLSRELAFEDAARVRDRIVALRRRIAGEEVGEKDEDVALAISAAPDPTPRSARNWRRGRRG